MKDFDDLNPPHLGASEPKKQLQLTGILFRADAPNKAGRVYPREVLERAVRDFEKNARPILLVNPREPFDFTLDEVQGQVTDMHMQGDELMVSVDVFPKDVDAISQVMKTKQFSIAPALSADVAEGRVKELEIKSVFICPTKDKL